MIEQQDSASNSVDSVPAAAMEIATQPTQPVTGAKKVAKGRFDEQIALMPDSIRQPIQKQLELMPQDAIFEIVENHGGSVSILYKTYNQAKEANLRKDSLANLEGSKVVSHAKAKLGSTYYTGKGDETATFGVGSLIEFQASGLLMVMLVITGLCILCYGMSALLKLLGLNKAEIRKPAIPQSPVAAAPVAAAMPTAEIHPGLSNEKLAVIFAVSAAEILGRPCTVVRFRPQNTNDWVWAIQGRTELHSNGLK
jgi:hypothetical protein